MFPVFLVNPDTERSYQRHARQRDSNLICRCYVGVFFTLSSGNVHCRDVIMICAHELQRHRARARAGL